MCGRVLREPFVDNDETVARVSFNKRLIINACVAKVISYEPRYFQFGIYSSYDDGTMFLCAHVYYKNRNICIFNIYMYNITLKTY